MVLHASRPKSASPARAEPACAAASPRRVVVSPEAAIAPIAVELMRMNEPSAAAS